LFKAINELIFLSQTLSYILLKFYMENLLWKLEIFHLAILTDNEARNVEGHKWTFYCFPKPSIYFILVMGNDH
jgi:hypothetical protein